MNIKIEGVIAGQMISSDVKTGEIKLNIYTEKNNQFKSDDRFTIHLNKKITDQLVTLLGKKDYYECAESLARKQITIEIK